MKTYILDGQTPVQVSLDEWARWFGRSNRVVAQEVVGRYYVSTIFIGLDRRYGGKGPPLLFETMVFRNSALDQASPDFGEAVEETRYASWDDAEAGHKGGGETGFAEGDAMMAWIDRHGTVWPHDDPQSPVGYLPGFLDEADPRPAREQFDANYVYGGWHPIKGLTLDANKDGEPVLCYPGDPPLRWIATTKLRDEVIILFQASIVVVLQPDSTFEAARLD